MARKIRLTKLHAKHFKSISDAEVDFDDLTILVGSNAVGKSNVVDAIRFIRDALSEGLDQAVSSRNGVRVVRQVSPAKKPFNVELSLEYAIFDTGAKLAPMNSGFYSFRISSSSDEIKVIDESATLFTSVLYSSGLDNDIRHNVSFNFFRDKGGSVWLGDENIASMDSEEELSLPYFDRLYFSRHREDRPFHILSSPYSIKNILLNARFAAVYPNVMRVPVPSQATAQLAEDCRNWASIIRTMRKTKLGKEGLDKVIQLMRYVLPQLSDVTIKSVGGFLVPHFRFHRGGGARDMDLVPYQLSDGTLRLFGLLLALYQDPAPSFLAIEEPEQMVHPGALRVLADAFNEAKERTQLLITTHSPQLLDMFPVENIRVVQNGANGTTVGRVSSRQIGIIKDGLMTLPEIMSMDGLESS